MCQLCQLCQLWIHHDPIVQHQLQVQQFTLPELRSSWSWSATSSFCEWKCRAAWALDLSSWYWAFWSLSCWDNFESSASRRSFCASIRDKSFKSEDVSSPFSLFRARSCINSASVSWIKFRSSSSMRSSRWLSMCSSSRSRSFEGGTSAACIKVTWASKKNRAHKYHSQSVKNKNKNKQQRSNHQKSIKNMCLECCQVSSSCARACQRRWPPTSGWFRPSFSKVSRLAKIAVSTGEVSPMAPSWRSRDWDYCGH